MARKLALPLLLLVTLAAGCDNHRNAIVEALSGRCAGAWVLTNAPGPAEHPPDDLCIQRLELELVDVAPPADGTFSSGVPYGRGTLRWCDDEVCSVRLTYDHPAGQPGGAFLELTPRIQDTEGGGIWLILEVDDGRGEADDRLRVGFGETLCTERDGRFSFSDLAVYTRRGD